MLDLDKYSERKFDIIAIGRACIDLNAVEYNCPMEETKTFAKYVGGSPVNIAIGTSKLGLKCGFIGKIAKDQHGNFIKQYMESCSIDTAGLVVDQEGHKTGLTFTEILSPQECSILMYRDEVADLYLEPSEVSEEYLKQTRLLLISGTALASSPSREAVLKSILIAKEYDVKIAFELDYRPYTWKSKEETSIYYKIVANSADIIIGTRDEYNILENSSLGDNKKTIDYLFKHNAQLIVIKHGVQGSYAYTKSGEIYKSGSYKSKVLKTFGAGDSYASGFLFALFNNLGYEKALKYGSAAASIVVSKHSSSEAMPSIEEIEELISRNEAL